MPGSPQSRNEYELAIQSIKQLLRERGQTYNDLAVAIGMSESGIKKVFSAKDGSFQRLIQICQFLGVSLMEMIDDSQVKEFRLSDRQQKEFLKKPLLFDLYWILVYERRTLESAQETLAITSAQAFSLARKLDQLKLIRLMPNKKIRIPPVKAVDWDKSGVFVEKIVKQWSLQLIEDIVHGPPDETSFQSLRYIKMKKKTYREFLQAVQALEAEFVRRSVYEQRTSPDSLEHVRWMGVADQRSFCEPRRIIRSPK